MSTNAAAVKSPPRAGLKTRHVLGLVGLGMLLAGLVLDPNVDPRRVSVLGFTVPNACGLRATTGIPCPSCGLTRAVCHSVRGDFQSAALFHPVGSAVALAGLLQAGFLALSLTVPRVRRARIPSRPVTIAYLTLGGCVIVVGTLRMFGLIPWPPL